jgi:hypothetical protein
VSGCCSCHSRFCALTLTKAAHPRKTWRYRKIHLHQKRIPCLHHRIISAFSISSMCLLLMDYCEMLLINLVQFDSSFVRATEMQPEQSRLASDGSIWSRASLLCYVSALCACPRHRRGLHFLKLRLSPRMICKRQVFCFLRGGTRPRPATYS